MCRSTSRLLIVAALLSNVLPARSPAADPLFRLHEINRQSAFCACAAVDVNHDGRLDIVCGGFWYEAPDWKRHPLRDVPMIRGRYDDYSNLPMDVNGDGWMDLVSANYRSETLFWIEHPGKSLGPWTAHAIDKPGPMETARLYDIDGDGQLDVLPNGANFAAWWEMVPGPEKPQGNGRSFRWVRHDLPGQLAGHGIGFGDINGDGRGDIVSPNGWLEAPPDRRNGTWRWRPDFRLHRDASVPILVYDVDGDGDADLVWGRGHNIGLYWMEQVRSPSGVRWVQHAIDTSWSQAHSPLLADIDGDGRPELIVGKRYLGHEGRDPGEYDPLVIYWYKFDPKLRTFHRGTISSGGTAGWGLDPKAVDLDGDGDIDLVAPGRSGLYWFENLTKSPGRSAAAGAAKETVVGWTSKSVHQTADSRTDLEVHPTLISSPVLNRKLDHTDLSIYRDEAGALRKVGTPFDWARRRADILANVEAVMGDLPGPERRVPLDVQVLSEESTPRYRRIKLTFAAEPGDRVPAWLLVPNEVRGRAPAALCLHQTTSIGKGEPAGLGGLRTLHYAHELAERGYLCLAPDYPSFGDYAYDFRKHPEYVSGSMKAIWNNHRAVDLLESLPEVDPDRICAIGHSLGGHNAIFTAVFDQRIRAVVTSCGFTGFHDYYGGKLAGWTSAVYMPRIRDLYGNDPDRVPFDFHELIAALAPRPVFVNAPLHDGNFDCGGVKKVIAAAAAVYRLRQAETRLRAVHPDCAHDFPDAVRQDAYRWLDGCWKQ